MQSPHAEEPAFEWGDEPEEGTPDHKEWKAEERRLDELAAQQV